MKWNRMSEISDPNKWLKFGDLGAIYFKQQHKIWKQTKWEKKKLEWKKVLQDGTKNKKL